MKMPLSSHLKKTALLVPLALCTVWSCTPAPPPDAEDDISFPTVSASPEDSAATEGVSTAESVNTTETATAPESGAPAETSAPAPKSQDEPETPGASKAPDNGAQAPNAQKEVQGDKPAPAGGEAAQATKAAPLKPGAEHPEGSLDPVTDKIYSYAMSLGKLQGQNGWVVVRTKDPDVVLGLKINGVNKAKSIKTADNKQNFVYITGNSLLQDVDEKGKPVFQEGSDLPFEAWLIVSEDSGSLVAQTLAIFDEGKCDTHTWDPSSKLFAYDRPFPPTMVPLRPTKPDKNDQSARRGVPKEKRRVPYTTKK